MCTFVGCPLGSLGGAAGGGMAACALRNVPDCVGDNGNVGQSRRRLLRGRRIAAVALGAVLLAAGLVCYLVLAVLCMRADGDQWRKSLWEGECWSEGGSMPYGDLGFTTGILLGSGFFFLLILLLDGAYGTTLLPEDGGSGTHYGLIQEGGIAAGATAAGALEEERDTEAARLA